MANLSSTIINGSLSVSGDILNSGSSVARILVGTYTGSGSTVTITPNFVPQIIVINNILATFSISGNTATISGNNTSGTVYNYKIIG